MSASEFCSRQRNPTCNQGINAGRCGEVFVTLSRTLTFLCSLCGTKQKNFGCFLEHLASHYGGIRIGGSRKTGGLNYTVKDETFIGDAISENSDHKEHQNEESDKDGQKEPIQDFRHDDINEESQTLEAVVARLSENSAALDEALYDFDALRCEEESGTVTEKETILDEFQEDITRPKSKRREKAGIFTCETCNKNFQFKTNYKAHIAIHSEERKYKCTICGFAFKLKANLTTHLRRHQGLKKISCSVCPLKFHTRSEHDKHMRRHTGEKPYICSYCGIRFSTSSALSLHTKRHTEEPSFKCNHCGKIFWTKRELTEHLERHRGDKSFSCPVCSAGFVRRRNMLRHKAVHNVSEKLEG